MTTLEEEKDVTPHEEEKDVTPHEEEKDATPHEEEKDVTPQEDEEEEGEDAVESLGFTITVENRSTMFIGVDNLQVRAEGAPAFGPDMFGFPGTGFQRGFGFCHLWTNKEVLNIGETIEIHVKTYTEKTFVLLSCQNRDVGTGVGICDGDWMGTTSKKDIKKGEHVVICDMTFSNE